MAVVLTRTILKCVIKMYTPLKRVLNVENNKTYNINNTLCKIRYHSGTI